jgi:hypothetical protein
MVACLATSGGAALSANAICTSRGVLASSFSIVSGSCPKTIASGDHRTPEFPEGLSVWLSPEQPGDESQNEQDCGSRDNVGILAKKEGCNSWRRCSML